MLRGVLNSKNGTEGNQALLALGDLPGNLSSRALGGTRQRLKTYPGRCSWKEALYILPTCTLPKVSNMSEKILRQPHFQKLHPNPRPSYIPPSKGS